ncbi:MAG: hypothetical protein ACTSWY_15705 [Promethearchaeota archaeon]
MAETVILCKEGTINSYLSALVIAMNKKKRGDDVIVVFMQEGLAALVDKKFRFASGLEPYAYDIKKNADMMGIPWEPFELIKEANNVGVTLYACQAWRKLLWGKPPKSSVPEGLQKLELSELIDELDKAKKVFSI